MSFATTSLSIIVPVYNVAECIERCVSSLPVDDERVEIILVNDGSTDSSETICRSLVSAHDNIILINQDNKGLSQARNAGLAVANGKFIQFIDSDDFILPGGYGTIFSLLEKDADVALINVANIKPSGNRIVESEIFENAQDIDALLRYLISHPEDFNLMAQLFLAKREVIDLNRLTFFPGIYHEDEDWTPRLLVNCRSLVSTSTPVYGYVHGREGSITASIKPKHVADTIKIVNRLGQYGSHLDETCQVKKEFLLSRCVFLGVKIAMFYHLLEGSDRVAGRSVLKKIKHMRGFTKKERLVALLLSFLGIPGANISLRLFHSFKDMN